MKITGAVEVRQIGDALMILGDCREVLPHLMQRPKMLLSDPPYRLSSGGQSGTLGGCFSCDQYDNSGDLFDIVEWDEMAPLFFDVLADNANAVVMANDRQEFFSRQAHLEAGFHFHRLLIWDKRTVTPNKYYAQDCEFGTFLKKGKARTISHPSSKAKIMCPEVDVSHLYLPDDTPDDDLKPHATEKPVPLMEYWMCNSTDPGDLVIDPFMGSGPVPVAAIRSGRHVIGIEKDPKWFHVACARVAEAVESGQTEFAAVTPESVRQWGLLV